MHLHYIRDITTFSNSGTCGDAKTRTWPISSSNGLRADGHANRYANMDRLFRENYANNVRHVDGHVVAHVNGQVQMHVD